MTDRSLMVVEPAGMVATAAEIRANVNLIQEVMKAVMRDGTHFGTIPGTPKPTLYKPGSEKILSTFRIAIEPVVEDLSTADAARFRVLTRATAQSSGVFLGAGVGECSSDEEKYRWRGIVHQKEWDATPEDRRRVKFTRDGKEIRQIRTHPADVANTVLKMAKKRSQIDVTLTVTAASDIFTQDIEDLPEELQHAALEGDAPTRPTTQAPQRRSQGRNGGSKPAEKLLVSNVKPCKWVKKDGSEGIFYALTFSDGREAATFSESIANLAGECCSDEIPVEVVIVDGNKPGTFKVEELRKVAA
jgi:hypothetical protein